MKSLFEQNAAVASIAGIRLPAGLLHCLSESAICILKSFQ